MKMRSWLLLIKEGFRGSALVKRTLSKNQFREAVYLDRRLKLVYEYQRWFDLIRQTGSAVTGVGPFDKGTLIVNLHKAGKTNATAKHYLYPIPQFEIDRNPKLTQNPGW